MTRSAGDPDEISAGAGIGDFSLVWNIGQGLSKSILGGPSTLTETIAAALRDRIDTGAQVHEVTQHKDHVVARFEQDGVEKEVSARTVIMATPATVSHKIGVDLRPELREALGKVQYGSYVAGAFLTDETTPQVWDSAYGIATPNRSMAVTLNMGNIVRGPETSRQPGGSIMCFSPATLANNLLPLTDGQMTDTYIKDLSVVLPGFENMIEESHIQRWELGAPYCFPGRAKLQNPDEARRARIPGR